MSKKICEWWKTFKSKCSCGKLGLLRCFCKSVAQQATEVKDDINKKAEDFQASLDHQTKIIQDNVAQQANEVKDDVNKKAENLQASLDQLTEVFNNHTQKIVDRFDIFLQRASVENNKVKSMFDGLLNHTQKRRKRDNTYQSHNSLGESNHNDFSSHIYKFSYQDFRYNINFRWGNSLEYIVHLLIILTLLGVLFFLPVKCNGQTTDSLVAINSIKTDIPIKSTLNGYNHIFARSIVVDSTYYVEKDSSNQVQQQPLSTTPDRTTIHGEIVYANTGWYLLLYCLLATVIVLTAVVLLVKIRMPYWLKKIDSEQKYRERRYNDYIRFSEEDREYDRLEYKTKMSLYEKREKAIIDEWQRDNEHERKLDIMEQERIANLSNVLLELAKTKNTVTLKDARNNGKTITIERSILSDDCCTDIKEVIKDYSAHGDDCCDRIKELLKCLFSDPVDCEKIKKVFRCFFCNDADDKAYADIIAKIDSLIAVIQSSGSNGYSRL